MADEFSSIGSTRPRPPSSLASPERTTRISRSCCSTKRYEVHGVKRRSSSFNTRRIEDIYQDPHQINARFHLHYGDLTDSTSLISLIQQT